MERRTSWLGRLGLGLAVMGAALLIASPIGYRMGWFGVPVALLQMVKYGMFIAGAGAVLGLLACLGRGSKMAAITGVVIGAVFGGYPFWHAMRGQNLPPIHDITTDTVSPPPFVALADARKAAPNGLDYKAEVAAKQKEAYPDVVPFDSTLAPAELLAKCEAAARASGWDIAAVQPSEGRLEATATSRIYGFKDDIVLRVAARDSGSRLDVRSMSRVGRGDVGMNADRIRAFFERLRSAGA
jgi:uncharacterized protein (DUF1499 family)